MLTEQQKITNRIIAIFLKNRRGGDELKIKSEEIWWTNSPRNMPKEFKVIFAHYYNTAELQKMLDFLIKEYE